MLHTHKDTQPHNKKAGVYKIPCECGKVYIGETGRDMDTRLKEHKTSFRLSEWEKSAIVKHAQQHDHRIMWDDTQLITSINNWNTRRVREAIEIHRHDTVPQDPGLHINNIWIPLLQMPSPTHATSPASATAPRSTPHPGDLLHVRTTRYNTTAPHACCGRSMRANIILRMKRPLIKKKKNAANACCGRADVLSRDPRIYTLAIYFWHWPQIGFFLCVFLSGTFGLLHLHGYMEEIISSQR